MAGDRRNGFVRSIQTLYDAGASAGLDDAELLTRFLGRGDGADAAFHAIVARHAAMVYEVCRSLAGTDADAEDAFQAVFLVLACRAASVRRRTSLASWLFGVARRVALRSRENAARRRRIERRAADRIETSYEAPGLVEDRAVLLEELERLPSRYREPIVLCHLQGLTYEAAARRIGCPLGTLSVRLKRAKDRLRVRLERRGVAAGAAGVPLARPVVPAGLVDSTRQLVSRLDSGLPPSVQALTQGALRMMRIREATLSTAALIVLAVGACNLPSLAEDDASAGPAPPPAGPYRLTGRVTYDEERGPLHGAPVPDAIVQVHSFQPGSAAPVVKEARTGTDGFYFVELPAGHASRTRLLPPPGTYVDAANEEKAARPFALSDATPEVRRDFRVGYGRTWTFRITNAEGRPVSNGSILAWNEKVAASGRSQEDGVVKVGVPFAAGEVNCRVDWPGSWSQRPLRFKIRWDQLFNAGSVVEIDRLLLLGNGQSYRIANLDRAAVLEDESGRGVANRYWLRDLDGVTAVFEDGSGGCIVPRLDPETSSMVIDVAIPEMTVHTLPEIVGTVVDSMGKPVHGAVVEVAHLWGKDDETRSSTMLMSERCRSTTDEDGRYRLTDVPGRLNEGDVASIRLMATAGGFVGAASEPIDVSGGAPVKAPGLTLKPGFALEGTVVDPQGAPVAGARLNVDRPHLDRDDYLWTDSEGRFRIDGLAEGPVHLQAAFGEMTRDPEQAFQAGPGSKPIVVRLVVPKSVEPGGPGS